MARVMLEHVPGKIIKRRTTVERYNVILVLESAVCRSIPPRPFTRTYPHTSRYTTTATTTTDAFIPSIKIMLWKTLIPKLWLMHCSGVIWSTFNWKTSENLPMSAKYAGHSTNAKAFIIPAVTWKKPVTIFMLERNTSLRLRLLFLALRFPLHQRKANTMPRVKKQRRDCPTIDVVEGQERQASISL